MIDARAIWVGVCGDTDLIKQVNGQIWPIHIKYCFF